MTATLPRIAARLDLCSGTWYAAESTLASPFDEHLIVWLPQPRIPAGAEGLYRWADEMLVESAHVVLDVGTVSELLYHDLSVNPDTLDDDGALAVVAAQLDAVDCDMRRCCADDLADMAEHPGETRMSRCVQRAARLCGVEA